MFKFKPNVLDGKLPKLSVAILHAASLLSITILCGCSSNDENKEVLTDPKVLFNDATSLLQNDKYSDAATKYEQLEREHPASDLAAQAQVNRAYAKYLEAKYIDSILISESFVKQYPAHPAAPYMYYLKGLCLYEQIVDVGRDQDLTYRTIDAFEDLINRFPDSKYTKDAKLKIDYAYNSLAGKEMEIGRFYLSRNNPIAAIGRFKEVVTKYQTTIFVPEALYRLTEVYYTLGDVDQAITYASVLGHNYKESEWYQKAYDLVKNNVSDTEVPWYEKITKIW